MLLLKGKQQHAFPPDELGMDDMGQLDIEMHMCHRALATDKKHGISFYEPLHQLFRPLEILDELWGMFEDVEQKDPPFGRSLPNHIDIFAKLHVIIGRV